MLIQGADKVRSAPADVPAARLPPPASAAGPAGSRPRGERVPDAITTAGGLLCAAVGVTVMVAWFVRATAVVRFGSQSEMVIQYRAGLYGDRCRAGRAGQEAAQGRDGRGRARRAPRRGGTGRVRLRARSRHRSAVREGLPQRGAPSARQDGDQCRGVHAAGRRGPAGAGPVALPPAAGRAGRGRVCHRRNRGRGEPWACHQQPRGLRVDQRDRAVRPHRRDDARSCACPAQRRVGGLPHRSCGPAQVAADGRSRAGSRRGPVAGHRRPGRVRRAYLRGHLHRRRHCPRGRDGGHAGARGLAGAAGRASAPGGRSGGGAAVRGRAGGPGRRASAVPVP